MSEVRESATRDCYVTALRKATRRVTVLYDDAMAPSGVRSTQYAVLRELAEAGPLTINELAGLLVMDRSGLGHSLRPLQRDGLVTLDKGGPDRRSVYATLTEDGRQRYEQASVLWRAAQDQVGAELGTAVADQLREQLNAIAEFGKAAQ